MAIKFSYGNLNNNTNSFLDPKATGPLAELYASQYEFKNLFYPRNLASNTRGHYMIFYINVASNSEYLKTTNYNIVGTGDGLGGRASANYFNVQNFGMTNVGTLSMPTIPVVSDAATAIGLPDIKVDLSRKTKRIKTAIALYMPDTVNVQYGANWQDTSLTAEMGMSGFIGQNALSVAKSISNLDELDLSKIGNILGTAATGPAGVEALGIAKSSIMGEGAKDFTFHAAGRALNPQLEVIFKGIGLRTFQFDFIFSPFNRQEAIAAADIIKQFKFHAAPEIFPNQGLGRYMIPPSEFDIDFMYKNEKNPHLHQIGTCVLTNVNVDYAPNGTWATFGGEDTPAGFDRGAGMPVQTRLTLQFQEVEIVTKQRIDEGY